MKLKTLYIILIALQLSIAYSASENIISSINVQIVNSSSDSTEYGGVLEFGWISLWDKTKCTADNPISCNEAVSIPINPTEESPIFTFTADPTLNILNAKIFYPITQDPNIPGGTYAVVINLKNGDTVTDRCNAEIIPIMSSDVKYEVTVAQYGSDEDNFCRVYVTKTGGSSQGSFVFLQNVPTLSNHWETFEIDGNTYLLSNLLAPTGPDNPMEVKNLFKFDSKAFKFTTEDRLIPNECREEYTGNWLRMDQVSSWLHFKVDEKQAVIMSNYSSLGKDRKLNCTDRSYLTKSYILWWENGKFDQECGVDCMNIATDSALMTEAFKLNNELYLAVAEQKVSNTSASSIYKWNDNEFVKVEQINLDIPHAYYIEAFQDEIGNFLIFSLGGPKEEVLVYQIDTKGQLHLYQSSKTTPQFTIAPEGFVQSSLVFKQRDETDIERIYLLLGYSYAGSNTAIPWLYRWEYDNQSDRFLFKPYQKLDNDLFKNAISYASYTIDKENYIAAVINTKGVYGYKWNNKTNQLDMNDKHIIFESQEGGYVHAVTPFYIKDLNSTEHLAVVISISNVDKLESPIMIWRENSGEK